MLLAIRLSNIQARNICEKMRHRQVFASVPAAAYNRSLNVSNWQE
jgi:hypothetical protein